MATVLLCGYGNIGKILYPELKKMASATKGSLSVYDPGIKILDNKPDTVPDRVLTLDREGGWDVAFMSVPTEKQADGSCNTSIVEALVEELQDKVGVIVIKSTIPPQTTKTLQEKFPKANLVYSPEFTSVFQHKGANADQFVILSGKIENRKKVRALYQAIYNGYFVIKEYDDFTTAEMVKYTINNFLAMKVTFFNEIADICKANGVDYDAVREGFLLDSRQSPSHTVVYPDQPFYNNHCFNKDTPALVYDCNKKGIPCPILTAVNKRNLEKKAEFGISDGKTTDFHNLTTGPRD